MRAHQESGPVGVKFFAVGLACAVAYVAASWGVATFHRLAPEIRWLGLPYLWTAFCSQSVLAVGYLLCLGVWQGAQRRAAIAIHLGAIAIIGMAVLYLAMLLNVIVNGDAGGIAAALNAEGARALVSARFWSTVSQIMAPVAYLVGAVLVSVVAITYARWRLTAEGGITNALGRSRFANARDLKSANLFQAKGSLIGRDIESRRLIRGQFTERLIVAPTRAGKDRGILLPALLTEDRGVVAFDPKGEGYVVTARARTRDGARTPRFLDPFGVLENDALSSPDWNELLSQGRSSLNLFDFIRLSEKDRQRDVTALVSALVMKEGGRTSQKGAGAHFEDGASMFLRGAVELLLVEWIEAGRDGPRPTLLDLHREVSGGPDEFRSLLARMALHDGYPRLGANVLSQVGKDEFGSFISTINRNLEWLADRNIADVVASTSFNLDDIIENRADLFIILPEDQIEAHRRLVTLVMQAVMTRLQQLPMDRKPERFVWFLVNEAGQLGYCKAIETAWAIIQSAGGIIWMVFQNRAQMEEYPRHRELESARIKHVFGTDDEKTMEWMVKLSGKETVKTESYSTGGNATSGGVARDTNIGDNRGVQVREVATELLRIEDIRTMPADRQLVLIRGLHPVLCERVNYDQERSLKGQWSTNPLERVVKK